MNQPESASVMPKRPGSMILHLDEADMLRSLSDRERGRLLLALIDYAQDGVLTCVFRRGGQ